MTMPTRFRAMSPVISPVAAILAAVLFLFAGFALAQPGPDPDRFIVKFKEGKGPQAKAALRRGGAELLLELSPQNAAAFRIPSQALAGIANNPNVEYIEADPPRYPMAEVVPYGITMVQAEPGVNGGIGPGGSVPKVCVIDSGYDGGHEDLPRGASTSGYPSDWNSDTCGHGSHVAGTIAALTGNATGVTSVTGGSVNLHIVKVFDGADCGWSYASTLVDASNQCASAGADIINMSLGCSDSGRGGPWSCYSSTEDSAFQAHYDSGILPVAAAGNDGSTNYSYPASYASVVSVAAIDDTKTVASFSQQNDRVELAAPGVGVLSTVPTGTGFLASVSANGNGYTAEGMDGSPTGNASAAIVNCGRATTSCTAASDGKICLIERGDVSFADKVLNCQSGGGAAAIIYNNEPGMLYGTMGDVSTGIPSVGISQADGQEIAGFVSSGATNGAVSLGAGNYSSYNGTSMATPHVAGVAALVWSHVPDATNAELRSALQATAFDLGTVGRDNAYGYGLVQAAAAVTALGGGGGGTDPEPEPENTPPTASFTYTCTDLACDFDASGSSDSNGTIAAYSWAFGDGVSGSGEKASHSYEAAGDYTVTLTVTDNEGATGTDSRTVSVTAPPGDGEGGLTLSATGYKVKGVHHADLAWSGAAGNVVVTRDATTTVYSGSGTSYTDNIGNKGGGSYTYQVCEAGTTTCSDTVTVVF